MALGDPPFNDWQLADMNQEQSVGSQSKIVLASQDPMTSESSASEVLRGATEGNTDSLKLLNRLPNSRNEALSVFSLGGEGSLVLVGPDCNEPTVARLALSDSLREFNVVHIATHAIVRPDAPRKSSLVLSQVNLPSSESSANSAPEFDGRITAQEIEDTWRLNAEIVSLTGCETGLGRKYLGEGFIGFTNVFLQQGASSVLASLWPVEDRSSSLLIEWFYELYLGNGPERYTKAASLAEAKSWLRNYEDELSGLKPFSHPNYWAGFVLIGNPD